MNGDDRARLGCRRGASEGRADRGRPGDGAVEIACPLWQGLDRLDAAFARGASRARRCAAQRRHHDRRALRHLSDARGRVSRSSAQRSRRLLAGRHPRLWRAGGLAYGRGSRGKAGSPSPPPTGTPPRRSLRARGRDALFVDMGSTTTDIIPIVGGKVAARGATDAERLQAGELVYTGATRTFLMAVAQQRPVPRRLDAGHERVFRARWRTCTASSARFPKAPTCTPPPTAGRRRRRHPWRGSRA